MLILLSKLLIAISLAGLLRCSARFRRMSRELDEQAFTVLRRLVYATEDEFASHLIPLLMLLTALWFMLSAYVTTAGGR